MLYPLSYERLHTDLADRLRDSPSEFNASAADSEIGGRPATGGRCRRLDDVGPECLAFARLPIDDVAPVLDAATRARQRIHPEYAIAATRHLPVHHNHEHPSAPAPTTGAGKGFGELGVPTRLVDVLLAQGVEEPFPIQAQTIPDALAGRDILGCGETGSGKTYAFLVPIVARLSVTANHSHTGGPRALILAPTRELATQIATALTPFARAASLTTLTVFGGTAAQPQIKALRRGVDIVVACPGRLDDHVRSGHAQLSHVEITVIDEADHMADLGFLPVVKRLLDATPRQGQRLLFSATLDRAVDTLTKRYLTSPASHRVPSARRVASAAVVHHVLHVDQDCRLPVLVDLTSAPGRTLVFSRTRRGTKRLAKQLTASGVRAVELHGDLSQGQRTRNLAMFMRGEVQTLVATDIAARGIHVDNIALVIHADPPAEHKAYVHRSGRTARAGGNGTVVTIATASQLEGVRTLTKRAGVQSVVSQVAVGSPRLAEIAPGERKLSPVPPVLEPKVATDRTSRRSRTSVKSRHSTGPQPRKERRAAAFSRSQPQPTTSRRARRRLSGAA